MTSDYVVWGTSPLGGFATLQSIENMDNSYDLPRGVPLRDVFPPDALYRMNPAFPRDVRLADAVQSLDGKGVPIVSPALRELLAQHQPTDLEFLPVEIRNHKDRLASVDYCIANPTLIVDALKLDEMGVFWNPLDPTAVMTCERMVLDGDALADRPAVCRPDGMSQCILVRRDVAEAIRAAGLTGTYFREPADVRA